MHFPYTEACHFSSGLHLSAECFRGAGAVDWAACEEAIYGVRDEVR